MRVGAVPVLMVCLVPIMLFGRVPKRHVATTDPVYGSALAAANRFLHAWQTQDHETGIMMLTDSARQHATRDQLQEFFSSGPDAAYEIRRGKRLSTAEYSFPVVLFNSSNAANHSHACSIVMVKAGKDDWAVDRLP
jgi:hypothetical protein